MNFVTALKNFSPFHFTSLFILFYFIHSFFQPYTSLHFTSLHFTFLFITTSHFPSLFTFYDGSENTIIKTVRIKRLYLLPNIILSTRGPSVE
jgi:hypothetical protein